MIEYCIAEREHLPMILELYRQRKENHTFYEKCGFVGDLKRAFEIRFKYGIPQETWVPKNSSAARARNADLFFVIASIRAMREESIDIVYFLVSWLGTRAISAVVYSLSLQSFQSGQLRLMCSKVLGSGISNLASFIHST